MRYALAQINTRVGDVARNVARTETALHDAASAGADVVLFPELSVPGCPPNDMLRNLSFVRENIEGVKAVAEATRDLDLHALVGFVDVNRDAFGKPLLNAMAQIHRGEIVDIFYKTLLPTYDVFDELRYFKANDLPRVGSFGDGPRFGPLLCEDLWYETRLGGSYLYQVNPVEPLLLQQPDLLINLSASPYAVGKLEQRRDLATRVVQRYGHPLVYVNLVGMNEGLVFDGGSFVLDARGRVMAQARRFHEDLVIWDDGQARPAPRRERPFEEPEAWFRATVLGIRDFFDKTGQPPRGIIGLSGGIDSALVTVLAVEALGRERVIAATLPSAISSAGSVDDSRALARRLGVTLHRLPIQRAVAANLRALVRPFKGLPEDVTEENLQSRTRGLLLMALANKLRGVVLSTGNKSELAVGYCTSYGDMIGGLAPIGDLYKTEVYELARWYNRTHRRRAIPDAILDKPPSAELRADQTDQDDLPPYEVLDPILRAFLEYDLSRDEIVAQTGASPDLVVRTLQLVAGAEWKRRQAPPSLRLHERAFGIGWRHPFMGRFPT